MRATQVGTWLSLVERTLGVGEVASSNLVVPTILPNETLLAITSKGFLYVGVTLTVSTEQFENSILSNLAFSA
jgi:hypothetical protein